MKGFIKIKFYYENEGSICSSIKFFIMRFRWEYIIVFGLNMREKVLFSLWYVGFFL